MTIITTQNFSLLLLLNTSYINILLTAVLLPVRNYFQNVILTMFQVCFTADTIFSLILQSRTKAVTEMI